MIVFKAIHEHRHNVGRDGVLVTVYGGDGPWDSYRKWVGQEA